MFTGGAGCDRRGVGTSQGWGAGVGREKGSGSLCLNGSFVQYRFIFLQVPAHRCEDQQELGGRAGTKREPGGLLLSGVHSCTLSCSVISS